MSLITLLYSPSFQAKDKRPSDLDENARTVINWYMNDWSGKIWCTVCLNQLNFLLKYNILHSLIHME